MILHDLVLLPFYSALDRAAQQATGSAINYVRVPAGLWLLLGLVFYPVIARRGDAAFHRVSGLHFEGPRPLAARRRRAVQHLGDRVHGTGREPAA